MNIQSMTGYGHGRSELRGDTILVDMTSLNHKSREVRLSLPSELQKLESFLTDKIGRRISRGSINLTLRLQSGEEGGGLPGKASVNRRALRSLARELQGVAEELGLADDLSLCDLLSVPGMVESVPLELPVEELKEGVDAAVDQALDALIKERLREGDGLTEELLQRGNYLLELIEKIDRLRDSAMRDYQARLRERIALLQVELSLDDERLAKEVAFAAQRTDVTEELVRLRAHTEQLVQLLREPESPVGRKLHFLGQEIHRESNTLGAKTGETEISQLALEFKSELEKIREQCLNIE